MPPKRKRLKNGTIKFTDYPDFRPNLTPREIFKAGAFGGTYWRAIKSNVTGKSYNNKQYKKYPKSWFAGIPTELLNSSECDISRNKYKVRVGTSLEYWESKGWITKYDPYGWVQWYCGFYGGKRGPDDERQIKRWQGVAGPKGRFKLRLINMLKKKGKKYNDFSVSPKIRQTLLHWAYEIKPSDLK